jgi:hypothetical protein
MTKLPPLCSPAKPLPLTFGFLLLTSAHLCSPLLTSLLALPYPLSPSFWSTLDDEGWGRGIPFRPLDTSRPPGRFPLL